jgi:hypothetical protein
MRGSRFAVDCDFAPEPAFVSPLACWVEQLELGIGRQTRSIGSLDSFVQLLGRPHPKGQMVKFAETRLGGIVHQQRFRRRRVDFAKRNRSRAVPGVRITRGHRVGSQFRMYRNLWVRIARQGYPFPP